MTTTEACSYHHLEFIRDVRRERRRRGRIRTSKQEHYQMNATFDRSNNCKRYAMEKKMSRVAILSPFSFRTNNFSQLVLYLAAMIILLTTMANNNNNHFSRIQCQEIKQVPQHTEQSERLQEIGKYTHCTVYTEPVETHGIGVLNFADLLG